MRLIVRLSLTAFLVGIILLFTLKNQIEDKWDQYGVGSYVKHKVQTTLRNATLNYLPPLPGVTGDKVIIMAKLEKDDTSWVTKDLFEYAFPTCSRS